ncbi:MAG: chemotaxis protein CheX [Termitinemataceae bacterium]|nr:MAG: chemotaxis protein CheX [Termitinemataceae bacterium]
MALESYIGPFIEVCENVFRKLGKVEIKAGRPYIITKADMQKQQNWDVSAVIGFTGEAIGAAVISFKSSLAIKLVDTLTGKTHTEMDREVNDVVGEIINIIAGRAKERMENEFTLTISLPTIVRGNSMSVEWPGNLPRIICIPFTVFKTETFTLAISIEQK